MSKTARGLTNSLARVVALAGLFSLVLTAVGQLLGTWWWPLELTSHFTAYYAAALLPASIVMLSYPPQKHQRLGLLYAGALLWNLLLLYPWYAPRATASSTEPILRLMTLNVQTSNTRHEAVLALIEQENPDVVALMEVNVRWVEAMAPLSVRYPVIQTGPRSDNFGIALYSRLPADSIETIDLGGAEVPSIAVAANVSGTPITLLATHPLPPIGAGYAAARNAQLAAIAEWSQRQACPVVVMGDLNVTRWSPYFRRLLRDSGLQDASRGLGLASTWRPAGVLPGIPIDHVLYSPEFRVVDRRVGPDVGSDHRPVIVDLAVRQ